MLTNIMMVDVIFALLGAMISANTIDDFFSRYASTMNDALFRSDINISSIMNSFSDYVVGANPLGVAGGKNDDQFAAAIRQGIDFYRKIGVVSMNILSKEINLIDDFHASVRIYWTSFYRKEDTSGEIPFEVVYLVQCREGVIKIFAYVTGDEQGAFREHNLLPESMEQTTERSN